LSYVKGVTSAIQTQLNAKGTFTLPSLTSGSVLFSDGTTISQNNANFFWDNTNARLGIGTASPSSALTVTGASLAGSAATSIVSLTQTWNTTGNPNAFLLNVTNTASGATSNLMNLQVGGASLFSVSKGGTVSLGAYGNGSTGRINFPAPYTAYLEGYNSSTGNFNIVANPTTSSTSKINLLTGGVATARLAIDYLGQSVFTPDANNTPVTITQSLTGSAANTGLSITPTWNTTGFPTAIKLNVTNTASGFNSLLMDLQASTVSQFSVNKVGNIVNTGSIVSGGAITAGGAVTATAASGFQTTGNVVSIRYIATPGNVTYTGYQFVLGGQIFTMGSLTPTVGDQYAHQIVQTFAPTSGTATFTTAHVNPTINQTGGANGISRGLYINPTITAAADFRGLEVANGSIVLPYSAQTGTYAIKTSDYLINATSGTYTATLPTAVGCTGKNYIIKNSGAGAITVATTSSQTIDGAATYSLLLQYKYVHVVSDGANWIITANN